MDAPTTSAIRISGDDAEEFLQGQLTNDLRQLRDLESHLTAWCTPKGRVIAVFDIARTASGYELKVPSELANDIVQRLTMYRFRASVEFEIERSQVEFDLRHAIHSGIPWTGAEQTEKFTPHMLNLDLLNAISFDKGCYTGQEIVARTHYKGATKRRTLRFKSDQPVNVGDKVSSGDRAVGEVLNVAANDLLAVVPVANASDALSAGTSELVNIALPYSIDGQDSN